jgi:hypothetical protein
MWSYSKQFSWAAKDHKLSKDNRFDLTGAIDFIIECILLMTHKYWMLFVKSVQGCNLEMGKGIAHVHHSSC